MNVTSVAMVTHSFLMEFVRQMHKEKKTGTWSQIRATIAPLIQTIATNVITMTIAIIVEHLLFNVMLYRRGMRTKRTIMVALCQWIHQRHHRFSGNTTKEVLDTIHALAILWIVLFEGICTYFSVKVNIVVYLIEYFAVQAMQPVIRSAISSQHTLPKYGLLFDDASAVGFLLQHSDGNIHCGFSEVCTSDKQRVFLVFGIYSIASLSFCSLPLIRAAILCYFIQLFFIEGVIGFCNDSTNAREILCSSIVRKNVFLWPFPSRFSSFAPIFLHSTPFFTTPSIPPFFSIFPQLPSFSFISTVFSQLFFSSSHNFPHFLSYHSNNDLNTKVPSIQHQCRCIGKTNPIHYSVDYIGKCTVLMSLLLCFSRYLFLWFISMFIQFTEGLTMQTMDADEVKCQLRYRDIPNSENNTPICQFRR